MCYDISFGTRYELITDYLPDIELDPQLDMNFPQVLHVQAQDCSPYPIIVNMDGKLQLTPLNWGVRVSPTLTVWNAMGERVIKEKDTPWYRIRGKRCLIPVSGIYEHRMVKGWRKKVPYYVRQRERAFYCVPGLYSKSQNTFTMVTREAVENDMMRNIHNDSERGFRMPLFLPEHLEQRWLMEGLNDTEIQKVIDFEMPSASLMNHTVFTLRTSKPHPTGGLKTDYYEWPNLPPLGQDTNELFLF